MRAMLKEDFKLGKELLEYGSEMDYVNKLGMSCLHLCVEFKKVKSIKFLLDRGANPHVEDLNGEDVCDKVLEDGLTEFPELM